jgi:hypothetical protein
VRRALQTFSNENIRRSGSAKVIEPKPHVKGS